MRIFGRESHYVYVETRDHGFKFAFDKDPRGLLHLTGRLPISAEAQVRSLGTALLAPGKLADSLVLVKTPSGTWLDQTEALSCWKGRERLAITRRAMTGTLIPRYYKYKLYPTILLMLPAGLPKQLPETIEFDRGGAFGGIRPNWVKLWECEAAEVLELDRRHLMHLVPLMKHTRTEVREAARRIRETGDEGQITLFLVLGETRYDKSELRRWIGMFHDAVVEIGKTTSFGQELIDVGRKEGLEKGMAKGLERGLEQGLERGLEQGLERGLEQGLERGLQKGLSRMTRAIRGYLRTAFPQLARDPAIDRIGTIEQAGEILDRLYRAKSEAAAKAVLRGR